MFNKPFKMLMFLSFLTTLLNAGVSKDLPYPKKKPDGTEIMKQVYFVNHFFAFKNYSVEKKRRNITTIVKRSKGKKPLIETVERYLNNNYNDGITNSKDLAIFRSGKNKGLGMLITDYIDDSKSQLYMAWLPALRKIRRFAEPAHEDAWGGTVFTFGDVTLRKPLHETHELLGMEKFKHKTGSIELSKSERKGRLKAIPNTKALFVGKTVFKVKSTTKFKNWWYDHRISYVDARTFGDYRTEYFKNGKMIKFIDRNWEKIGGQKDPRALRWATWYGKDLRTGFESMAFMPRKVTNFNSKKSPALWSEKTLRKIKR